MANSKQTGKDISKLAGELLQSPKSSKIQKQLSASALSQTSTDKQPSKEIETIAAKVLASDKYNTDTKAIAASLLSQSNSTN